MSRDNRSSGVRAPGCALALLLALAGCAQVTESASGGETNWLRCEHDDDCGEGSACREQVCVPNARLAEPTDTGATDGDGAQPDTSSAMSADGDSDLAEPVPTQPASELDQLGLALCADAGELEWLAELDAPMQVDHVSALDDGGILVLAAETGVDGAPATPQIALLAPDGTLGDFEPIPDAYALGQSIGAGPYVASIVDETASFLFRWQGPELSSISSLAGLSAIADAGDSVVAGGQLFPVFASGRAWLGTYDTSGAQRWRITPPPDAASPTSEATEGVARDEGSGELSWLVGRNEDDAWRQALVRVDAGGEHRWTARFDPEEALAWNTALGDRLDTPGIATAGGVTSIAGSVYAGSDTEDAPALRLSFRQLDEPGARTRRWDGLDTDIALSTTPIAADDDGQVYVGWTVQRRTPLVRRSVVLRFDDAGDPCVLADLGDDMVNALALRETDLIFSGTLRVGRVSLHVPGD